MMGAAQVTGAALAEGASPERTMRADARRNYQRLIDAAVAAFTEQGADDVSLEAIARRAGVGIGTLYRHFPTRQALLEAVYLDQVEALGARAADLLETAPPAEALTAWLRSLVAFGKTKRSLSAALLATLDKDSDLLVSCKAIYLKATNALLERAREVGAIRPGVTATDVIRLAHGVGLAADMAPEDTGQAERMISVVIAGLLTTPPAS